MLDQDNEAVGDVKLKGFLRRDLYGRLFVDTCATDEEHLTKQTGSMERPDCRKYIEDLFPSSFDDKKVWVWVHFRIWPAEEG